MKSDLAEKPFIVIDLGSGSFLQSEQGHEIYNLEKNPVTHKYYGYCPPHDNIDITKLGAKTSDSSVSDVMVIYVRRILGSSDRKIIAFTDNAHVYKKCIFDKKLNRTIKEKGRNTQCSYSIESDVLYNLMGYSQEFIIHLDDYNRYMFRYQRFYKGRYKSLDSMILRYLDNYFRINNDDDDFEFQREINLASSGTEKISSDPSKDIPKYSNGANGKQVVKSQGISKSALRAANYKCAVDCRHITFLTPKGTPYMEGHHLIPCTAVNSEYFWERYKVNIDCKENIVCLCPTCHRNIHFGTKKDKVRVLKRLYARQRSQLNKIGLCITFEELIKLYE